MSDKYIIKNCPVAFNTRVDGTYCNDVEITIEKNTHCQYITDCVMKQIVELCKQTCRKRCTNDCLGTKKHCGYGQILKLLDIQEVE